MRGKEPSGILKQCILKPEACLANPHKHLSLFVEGEDVASDQEEEVEEDEVDAEPSKHNQPESPPMPPRRFGSLAGCSADTSGVFSVNGGYGGGCEDGSALNGESDVLNGSPFSAGGSVEILASTGPTTTLEGDLQWDNHTTAKEILRKELTMLRNDLLDSLCMVDRLMKGHKEEVSC